MAYCGKVGEIQQCNKEAHYEWTIPNFFNVIKGVRTIKSPKFRFERVPVNMELVSGLGMPVNDMHLFVTGKNSYSVVAIFGLKTREGSVMSLGRGYIKGNKQTGVFFTQSEIREQRFELAPMDVLTVIVKLRRELTPEERSMKKEMLKDIKLSKLDTLSENLKNLFFNKKSCDTTLYVQGREFKAHRAILMARSSVFSAMFTHDTHEKQTGIVVVPDSDSETFEDFLNFLYCGEYEKPSFRNVFHLYETSEKYDVQELKSYCANILLQYLEVKSFYDLVIFAHKYGDMKILSAARIFFLKNHNEISTKPEWDCLLINYPDLANELLNGM